MGPERAAVSVLARLAGVGCINAMGPLTCNRSTNATAGQGSRAAVRALTRATAPARSSEAHGGGATMAAAERRQRILRRHFGAQCGFSKASAAGMGGGM